MNNEECSEKYVGNYVFYNKLTGEPVLEVEPITAEIIEYNAESEQEENK